MQSPLRAMYKLNFLHNIRVENWCHVRILPQPSFWFNYMGRCAIAYTFQKCSVQSAEKIRRIFDLFIGQEFKKVCNFVNKGKKQGDYIWTRSTKNKTLVRETNLYPKKLYMNKKNIHSSNNPKRYNICEKLKYFSIADENTELGKNLRITNLKHL